MLLLMINALFFDYRKTNQPSAVADISFCLGERFLFFIVGCCQCHLAQVLGLLEVF